MAGTSPAMTEMEQLFLRFSLRLPLVREDIRRAIDTNIERRGLATASVGSRLPIFDDLIKMVVPRVHFHIPDSLDGFLGKLANAEHLTIAPLEPRVFLGGNHHRPVLTVAGTITGWLKAAS